MTVQRIHNLQDKPEISLIQIQRKIRRIVRASSGSCLVKAAGEGSTTQQLSEQRITEPNFWTGIINLLNSEIL